MCSAMSKSVGLLLALALMPSAALAQQTVALPASASGATAAADAVLSKGFDDAPPTDPSTGSGGAFPGPQQRTVDVPGIGQRTYYLHVPSSYMPTKAAPLLVALNGAGGNPSIADSLAQAIRFDWSFTAEPGGFIVAAPIASGSQGGWVPGADDAVIDALVADVATAYNIERTRRYLWGFSAGANFGHEVVLQRAGMFAGYGVAGGSLLYYACDRVGKPSCAMLLGTAPRRVPVQIHIGLADPRYPTVSGDPARFTGAGWVLGEELRYTEFQGGHQYTLEHLAQAWAHVCRFAVTP
jgi:poly(3-hydroxybutyrate) depolymerase